MSQASQNLWHEVMSDNDAPPDGTRFNTVLNSTVVVALARLVLPTILAVVGALMLIVLHDVEGAIGEVRGSTEKLWSQMGEMNKAAVQAAIAAQSVSSDLTAADRAIADHEQRIRLLEHTPH
jgi:hypothetical protein